MRHLSIVSLLMVIIISLIGCKTSKQTAPPTFVKDSTNIKVIYRTEWKTDTVYLSIPAQKAESTVRDSSSFLENDFASSLARINPDGSLFHNLNTKPQDKPIPIKTQIEYRDSIAYKSKLVKIPIIVERELSEWEKTCKDGFPIVLFLLFLSVSWNFRKPLLNLIRRFI